MSGAAVELGDVVVNRGGHAIVDRLSLTVAPGEVVVLLGRSGSGKTTTLRLVNRLVEPDAGTVKVAGRSTREWDAIALRRRTGYVIQETGLFPHMTVERNVALVPALEGWDAERRRTRVRELLTLIGLDPEAFAGRYPHQLSGGQRQRVGVARALAADPPVLLMDEPFAALDPLTRTAIQREFKALQARLGTTVLLVSHDVREALVLAHRIALLAAGRLAFLGTAAELKRSPHPEAIAYLATLEDAA